MYFQHAHVSYNIFLALCSPGCENGGTCTAPDTCDCVTGYSGDRCQNGMF